MTQGTSHEVMCILLNCAGPRQGFRLPPAAAQTGLLFGASDAARRASHSPARALMSPQFCSGAGAGER